MKKRIRRAARAAALPAVSFFDPRFTRLEEVVRSVGAQLSQRVDERIGEQQRRLTELYDLERQLLNDADATHELARLNGRLAGWLREALEMSGRLESRPPRLDAGANPEELTEAVAQVANFVESHRGFAAQAGLWFNPPCYVEHRAGGVVLGGINERIIEVPYVFAAVAGLPPGSSVLDFGSSESTVSLSLASLGFHVTSLDLRPYPVDHPNLTAVAKAAQEWEGPARPFDAIICLSTLEHVGLGWYGETATDEELDVAILERLGGWLAPGGVLAFTAPFGQWSVTEFERRYDLPHLERLFAGWTVEDRRFARQTSPTSWEMVEDGEHRAWTPEDNGVVLLKARRGA